MISSLFRKDLPFFAAQVCLTCAASTRPCAFLCRSKTNPNKMAERYSFPILKVDEIRDTMNELQINLTNDDLTQQ